MTSESARDVLREELWQEVARAAGVSIGRAGLEAIERVLLAHPTELLALLAEPKVCETCEGTGHVRGCDDADVWLKCSTCHGTGEVVVDVLDLLVQAGLVEQVGWEFMSKGNGKTRNWLEIDTPWEPELEKGETLWRKLPAYVAARSLPKDGTP